MDIKVLTIWTKRVITSWASNTLAQFSGQNAEGSNEITHRASEKENNPHCSDVLLSITACSIVLIIFYQSNLPTITYKIIISFLFNKENTIFYTICRYNTYHQYNSNMLCIIYFALGIKMNIYNFINESQLEMFNCVFWIYITNIFIVLVFSASLASRAFIEGADILHFSFKEHK